MICSERIRCLLNGEKVDKIPLFPFMFGFCAKNVGYPIECIYSDAHKSFDAQIKTLQQFGFDWGPIYGYASYGTWEFGGEIEMPSGGYQQAPIHKMFPVKSEYDVKNLVLPDIENAGCIPVALEFSRLQKEYNMPISVMTGGNFTIAGNICSVELLCRWMLRAPELVHKIMKLSSDHIVNIVSLWIKYFGAVNVIPMIWEPLTDNRIITKEQFGVFVFPYLFETSQKILDMGINHTFFHICGEQNANLPYWAKVPMGNRGLCSISNEINISEAAEFFGHQHVIIGNISPKILLNEDSETVRKLCEYTIEEGKKLTGGFMLSTGCEISPNTPGYNLFVMKNAIDNHGWIL